MISKDKRKTSKIKTAKDKPSRKKPFNCSRKNPTSTDSLKIWKKLSGSLNLSIKRKSKGRNRESKRDWKVFLLCFFVL
jgi:hypothetical protein